MPTQPKPPTPLRTQEVQAVQPKTSPDNALWHTWQFQEADDGISYQHEFGQAITQRDATDRILKLHGLTAMPDGAKVYHEEAAPVVETAPVPVPEAGAPVVSETTPSDPENPENTSSQS